uniref:Histone domain-containing protein n=1 Tax=Haemonchus contortus TaxID=6289 RepID=A0A7I4XXE2_HAECO
MSSTKLECSLTKWYQQVKTHALRKMRYGRFSKNSRIAQDALWTILEKFPYSIVKKVLITTQSKEEVKIEDIMNELEKEIEAKKFMESRLRNFSKHDHKEEEKDTPVKSSMRS